MGSERLAFLRIGEPGAERPIVRCGEVDFDLRGIASDIDGEFLASDGVARTRVALAEGRLEPAGERGSARIGAPIARPQAVICVGQNYAAHAAESGSPPPGEVIMFFKHPNTIVGPFDDVVLPPAAARVDWEVELGVVIGRRARYLGSHDEAMACVAGFVVSNDVSEREFQLERSGGQWSKGKSFETFNPLGPWFVPADLVDPGALTLWSRVNGEPRQHSRTSDMIFSVAELVLQLSQVLVLEPGDLVNTGTPEGVALSGRFPYLGADDVVEVGIEGLGAQRSRVTIAVEAPRR